MQKDSQALVKDTKSNKIKRMWINTILTARQQGLNLKSISKDIKETTKTAWNMPLPK